MRTLVPIAALSLVAAAQAQTTIDPAHKFCWTENAGWFNWADANSGVNGVRDRATYLSGYIWGENTGWINVGGSPTNNIHYANTDSSDYGRNIDGSTGAVGGFAWSENVGWINFSAGAQVIPPSPAYFDDAAGRFRGYAWGENIGWINLDDTVDYVKRQCYANCDGSTTSPQVNVSDFLCYLQKFAKGDPYANCDRSDTAPLLNVADFTCYLQKFAQPCP